MKPALTTGILALAAIAITTPAQSQHAAPMATAHATPAPHAITVPAAKSAGSHSSATRHSSTSTTSSAAHRNASAYPLGPYSVNPWPAGSHFTGPVSPGGFTNPLAGTNKGHGHSNGSTGIILFGGGYGYGYGYDPSADDAQLQASDQSPDDQQSGGQQPQYIFVQQVPDPRGQAQRDSASDQPQPAAAQEPAVPLRDVGSFTLVTQAGYRLDAVAFTRSADRLVYITPDGGRRSIAFRDLDVAATQRVNQENGTPVEIPLADESQAAPPKSKPSSEITN
ncbi:MAG TPA: hypothetical protein VGD60_18270 [Candidatus Acidoferrales bacterium]